MNYYRNGNDYKEIDIESANTNRYSIAEWEQIEKAGAVFLPITGTRQNNYKITISGLSDDSMHGMYWTSTAIEKFGNTITRGLTWSKLGRYGYTTYDGGGCAVRLVQEK